MENIKNTLSILMTMNAILENYKPLKLILTITALKEWSAKKQIDLMDLEEPLKKITVGSMMGNLKMGKIMDIKDLLIMLDTMNMVSIKMAFLLNIYEISIIKLQIY